MLALWGLFVIAGVAFTPMVHQQRARQDRREQGRLPSQPLCLFSPTTACAVSLPNPSFSYFQSSRVQEMLHVLRSFVPAVPTRAHTVQPR